MSSDRGERRSRAIRRLTLRQQPARAAVRSNPGGAHCRCSRVVNEDGASSMRHVNIGKLDVGRIGFGAMGLSGVYGGTTDEAEGVRVIHRALDAGVPLSDTAEVYGPYGNEELVGRAIADRRDEVVLATKFGFISHTGREPGGLDSSRDNVRTAVEGSLKRLGTDRIDLFYQHRVDPKAPIEETVGALSDLAAEGKVRHIGLSE